MNHLVYLSYGRGPHSDELIYAVLSAIHMMGRGRRRYRILVYTDNEAPVEGLPVDRELIDSGRLADWAGPFDFNHRRKICVIRDALQKFGGRVAYCDTDTYFYKHPRKLFARIRPGHTVMHTREYRFADRPAQTLAASLEGQKFYNKAGQRWNITPASLMFNAGVIGLHEADESLLDEVIYLTDQMYLQARMPTIEQFAFSLCLHRHTTLRQSHDIIHHYWSPADRALFHEHLSRVLHNDSGLSHEERFRQLLPHAPPCPYPRNLREWIHLTLWKVARKTGILDPLKRIIARARLGNRHASVE